MADKIIVEVVKKGNIYKAFDKNGGDFTSQISTATRKNAFNNKNALERKTNKNGDIFWSQVSSKNFTSSLKSSPKSLKKKAKRKSKSTRVILDYKEVGDFSSPYTPTWEVRYSDGSLFRIKVRCPKCKGTGGFSAEYGGNTLIRPDSKRCLKCTSSFKSPQIYVNDQYDDRGPVSSSGCMVIFLLLSSSFFTMLFLILK